MENLIHIDESIDKRTIPLDLISQFANGAEFFVIERLSRTGGATRFHQVTCLEDLVEILNNRGSSKLELYKIPIEPEIILSVKGQSY